MRFYAWDPAKAASNFMKHGIRFEEAVDAFDDPFALTVADRVESGERRWQTLGSASGTIVLFVAHTEEDEGEDEMSASSQRDAQPGRSVEDMKQHLVRVTGAEPLTEERRRELAELAERPDSEIDFSDIPEWTEEMFARAVRGKYYRPMKSQLTVRLDSDVLVWLKAKGRGYQTKINAILRRAMLEDVASK